MKHQENGHILGTANGRDVMKGPENGRLEGRLTRARVRVTSARPPKLSRRLYDIQAVADYLGIPPYTVRGLIWNGSLPCVRIGRRQYLDIRDVDRFIEQAKTSGE